MAFSFKKKPFNFGVGTKNLGRIARNTAKILLGRDPLGDILPLRDDKIDKTFDTIEIQAIKSDYTHKPLGEENLSEVRRVWQTLRSRGTTLKCNYRVSLKPLGDSNVKLLPIFKREEVGDPILGFLATDVEIPVLAAAFEQKRFGIFNFSRLSDCNYPTFTITFLETENQAFLRSLEIYRGLVFNSDGTANPPANYAIVLSVKLYGNGKLASESYVLDPLVVAISLDSLQGLSSRDPAALEIPIAFSVLSNQV